MNIEHVMSKDLIVFDVNSNINDIAKTMKEKDIGIIPISKNKTIIGVLTDRDIVVKILANKDNKIENYVSKNVITIDKNESLQKAIELMGEKKIRRLLVKDNNKLVGIVSISDLINYLDSNALTENMKKIFEIYRNSDEYLTKIDEFKL